MAAARIPVVYIAGAGRSGSTMLERLLHERLDVAACGELARLWNAGIKRDYSCSCSMPFSRCAHWQAVVARQPGLIKSASKVGAWVQEQQTFASLRKNIHRKKPLSSEMAASVFSLLASILEVSNSRAIVDSTKGGPWAALLASIPTVELKVIHLVRDSRAVAFSWTRSKKNPARHDVPEMKRLSLGTATRHWNTKNTMALALRYSHASTYQRLHYEDLCAAPEEVLDQLIQDLQIQNLRLPEPRGGEDLHQVWGNPMRLQKGPVAVQSDQRWREEMSIKEQRRVLLRTSLLRVVLGYRLWN